MRRDIHKILFSLLLVLAFLPLIYMHSAIPAFLPLKGEVKGVNFPKANKGQNWWNTEFQSSLEKFVSNEFTKNNTLLTRFYNQYRYSFFKGISTENVIEGQDEILFEEDYIISYLGLDYVGQNAIHSKLRKIKGIQESLDKKDKQILLVLAPGKATFYSDKFPAKYQIVPKENNYNSYVSIAEELEVDYIDFNKFFLDNKEQLDYPLYPKTGIHWSSYGAVLAIDSIFSYLNESSSKTIPKVRWEEAVYTDDYRYGDDDIEEAMNLLLKINDEHLAYPMLKYAEDEKSDYNLLVVADSYYWTIHNQNVPKNTFKDSHFWYYNNSLFDNNGDKRSHASIDLKQLIEDVDGIVILSTESNLKNLGWGFIEKLHQDLYLETSLMDPAFKIKIQNMKEKIKSTPDWYERLLRKSEDRGISIDSVMTLESIWLLM